jgi:hypothetical protein
VQGLGALVGEGRCGRALRRSGRARRREGRDRDAETVPGHDERQAREAGVAVHLQRVPLCRVPVAPVGVVGEPQLLAAAHGVRRGVAGVQRHALPVLLCSLRPVLQPETDQRTVAQLPRRDRLHVEQLPQLRDHDGADLRRRRGRRQRRGGVLQQPQPVVGPPLAFQQLLTLGLGAAARGDVAADGLHPAGPGGAHAEFERHPAAVAPTQVPHLGTRAPRTQRRPQRRQPGQLRRVDDVADAQVEVAVAGVPEQVAGRGVRGEDAAVVVGEPDAVAGPLDQQPVALLVLPQCAEGVHALERLPAAVDHREQQRDLGVGPPPRPRVVHRHRGDEPAGLVQGHTDHGGDPGVAVDLPLVG